MNFKFKRLYQRIFSVFLVITIAILSVPISAVAEESGNEERQNIEGATAYSESTIATDLSQEVIWPVVSDEEAMRREQLIQNGYSPDDYSVSEYKQMVAKGELQPLAVYPAVLADGVYAIKNIGNSSGSTGFYLDTALAHWLPGYNMQQYKFENGTSPLDNFEVSTLFKITRNASSGSYVIRIMRNNVLSFGIHVNPGGSNEILTKKIPLDDSEVALSDTYTITTSGSGYKICKYGTTNLIATKDTTASGAAGAPDSYLYASSAIGDHARWTFSAYTGPERSEMTMLGSGSLEVAKTSTLDPVFYSTRPGYNVVSLNMSQVPTSYYTLSGPNDYGIHSLTPHQGTAWTVGIFLKNGSSASAPRILVKLETWNIALPIDEGVYFLNNVEYPNKYVQINNNNSMLNSGEIIELHQFYGYSYQRWEVEHVLDGYYKIISQYSGLELTAPTGANNDVVTQTTPSSANTHLWKFIKQSDGTYRISPKSNSNYFMAAGAESSAADQDLEIRTTQSDSSDEWRLKLDHLVVEFYYDQGFIKAAKNGTESDAITIANIESNISNVYFHYVARAFQTKFGIQFSIKFIENYTSDADNCPKTTGRAECTCITASNCLLNSFDNPLTNNNAAGFTKSVHCKSLIRLRNNLVVNLPENTVRIAYTGHHACIITDDHNYYAEGLSNYDYPIICMRYPVSPTDTRFVYLMAHEISHFYDLGHHDNGSQCIMDEAKPPININDPNTFWCDDCIATINSNKNKFYIN